MTKKKIALEIFTWVFTLLVAALMLRAGITKFDPHSWWVRGFRNWGYPDWFRYTIGVVEVACAILLLWPRTASYAATVIIAVMIGAAGTLAHAGLLRGLDAPIGFTIFCTAIAFIRWPRRLRFGASLPVAERHAET